MAKNSKLLKIQIKYRKNILNNLNNPIEKRDFDKNNFSIRDIKKQLIYLSSRLADFIFSSLLLSFQ